MAHLQHRLESQNISVVFSVEQALIKAEIDDDFECEVKTLKEFCYKHRIDWSDLSRHLAMLQDIIKKGMCCAEGVFSL